MIPEAPSPKATLPQNLAPAVDRACDRFEAAWREGARPRIEDYLREVPETAGTPHFSELLALDLAYRERAREPGP